ncbi:MAG: isocitrate lyase/PEP mutase family protein [Syntrophorhabdales bacterium]|jgi:2-methylisocitrate lyase-like PEP mutase family enzyme
MSKAEVLRSLLKKKNLLVVPGVYDGLTSRIAGHCGAQAIYMTGFGTAAAWGYPDFGLLTMTEMLENVRRISDAVDIPLIADADTGYGNVINVYRTVREYERAGAAAIQFEDQTWPKRCGHMEGKQVISSEEMVGKIKAAVDARVSAETILVVRTDAVKTHGFDEAILRGAMYAEAGADVLFIEAPANEEQMRKIPGLFEKPCVMNMAVGIQGVEPKDLAEMGYAIVIYPLVTLIGAIEGAMRMCTALIREGRQAESSGLTSSLEQLSQFLGLDKIKEMEGKYV